MTAKTITFDFDHTLKFETGETNEEGVAFFRKHMDAGDTCHVVTSRFSRNPMMAQEIHDFLKEHKLVTKSVTFTNGKRKLDTLQELGCDLHFDDDPFEITECEKNGIKATRLFDIDKWNAFLDKIGVDR